VKLVDISGTKRGNVIMVKLRDSGKKKPNRTRDLYKDIHLRSVTSQELTWKRA